jgi:hypothetical protein
MVSVGRKHRIISDRMRVAAGTAFVLASWLGAGLALAQPPAADAGWSTLRVPGGVAQLLRVAGLDPGTPRSLGLSRLVRSLYSSADNVDPVGDRRRSRVSEYLQTLSAYERARAALPADGISLAQTSISKNALDDYAEAAGGRIEREGKRAMFLLGMEDREVRRRGWLAEAGLDVASIAAELNAGRRAGAILTADEVPSPLSEVTWRNLLNVKAGPAGVVTSAILADRRAALLLLGLSSVDAGARSFLNSRPDVLERIYGTDRVGTLASSGRSLRMSEGRLEVPGGADAVPLWENLIDESVARPERFLLNLLEKDDGRAAAFYDALAQLEGPRQAFALGAGVAGITERLDRFRAFYEATQPASVRANPVERPFGRSVYEAAHVLALTRFGANGQPQGPVWRTLWDKAMASTEIPERPGDEVRDIETGGILDAADLIELVCIESTNLRRQRAELWFFAQRVFVHPRPADMPGVLVALRGFRLFGTLVLTIERMGVTDPAVYAKAVVRAQSMTGRSGSAGANALALFQGSIAIIDHARRGRAIGAETAGELVLSLSSLPLADDGKALGAVARWIVQVLMPALGASPATMAAESVEAPLERYLLRAFAGQMRRPGNGVVPTVEIEGLRYRVDPAAAEETRLAAIRKAQGGLTLDQVLAFSREVEALAAGVKTAAILTERMSALAAAARPLQAEKPAGPTSAGEPPDVRKLMAEALQRFTKIQKSRKLKDVAGIVRRLQPAVDYALAEVLLALAYAPHLDGATGRALRGGDPSPGHNWRLDDRLEPDRTLGPWRMPVGARDASGKWRVSGAVLALEQGLRELQLRRVFTESFPDPPTIKDNDRAAFAESVSLSNPLDYLDTDRTQIVAALRRGRATVALIRTNPELLAGAVTAVGISDPRRELLWWALTNEPDRLPELFTLAELLRLGQLPLASIENLDAWGMSAYSAEGCLCLKFPQTGEWLASGARPGQAVAATRMPDLVLFVAEWLADRNLPAALTRFILASATLNFEDELRMAFDEDWLAMSWQVPKTLRPRMDDYVASLTTSGPLVPAR